MEQEFVLKLIGHFFTKHNHMVVFILKYFMAMGVTSPVYQLRYVKGMDEREELVLDERLVH